MQMICVIIVDFDVEDSQVLGVEFVELEDRR